MKTLKLTILTSVIIIVTIYLLKYGITYIYDYGILDLKRLYIWLKPVSTYIWIILGIFYLENRFRAINNNILHIMKNERN